MGKTTSRAGNGINEDGTHQSARAAKAIRKNTEKEAANRGSDQREGIKKASGGFAHAELGHQIGEDERVQHDVHGVEHPTQAAGNEGFAFRGRNVPRPRERRRRAQRSAGWGSGVARCHLVLPPLGRSLWVRGAIDAFRDALNEKR